MLTIGDKFPSFDLKAVVSTDAKTAFTQVTDKTDAGQVEGRVLLAEGLHLRLPDRDRRLRQAEQGVRRARRRGLRRLDRQRVRPSRLAPEPRRPEDAADRHAGRSQARAVDGRSASSTRARASACARPSSSIRTASSASSRSTTSRSAATRRKCCACSTRCRPTSSAPATGRRARRS